MEQSACPVTSTVLNPSESPKSPRLASCGSSPKGDRDSPEPNCAICLGKTENKSFTDSCLHQFCFSCLLEWSKVKAECPLCKQSFKSIIHNVRSNEEYEEYHVEATREARGYWQEEARSVVRFRYSTTLTPERQRDRFLETLMGPLFFRHDAIPPRRVTNNRRRNRNSTSEFRASIYRDNLWVNPLPDITGRFRDCSPEFYRLNPAQLHRLVPWLNRELNVLRVPSSHLLIVIDLILNLLNQFSITSNEFHQRVAPHLGANSAHFIHEFYAFARSPYDMVGFDQSADYNYRQMPYLTEVQAIDSDSDSDVIVLSPTHTSSLLPPQGPTSLPPPPQLPRHHIPPPVSPLHVTGIQPLNLSASSSHPLPRLSPVAGPSSVDEDFILMITQELQNPTYPSYERVGPVMISTPPAVQSRENQSQTIDSDSDADDCVIVGYVKPRHERTPEIITLASDVGSDLEVEVRASTSVPAEDIGRRCSSSTSVSSGSEFSDPNDVPYEPKRSIKRIPKQKKVRRPAHSFSSTSSSSKSKSSDPEFTPNEPKRSKKGIQKRKKIRRRISSSSDGSESSIVRRLRAGSSDSDFRMESAKHKKYKSKGKCKRIISNHDSTDDNKSERSRNNRIRKSRKEVWRIVRKQEPEIDHDYSLDCYDPPFTEDERQSLSSDRPKLRSIVITKSGGSNGHRDPSYSSVASSSRSSSHYHEGKCHRPKSHRRESKKRKERYRSESNSPVRHSYKGKKLKSKRTHRNPSSDS